MIEVDFQSTFSFLIGGLVDLRRGLESVYTKQQIPAKRTLGQVFNASIAALEQQQKRKSLLGLWTLQQIADMDQTPIPFTLVVMGICIQTLVVAQYG